LAPARPTADHQPLYRQEAILGRAGLAIPRSTLAQWVGICGVRLQPLVDALKAELLQHRVLHADETPVALLAVTEYVCVPGVDDVAEHCGEPRAAASEDVAHRRARSQGSS